jgi:cell division septation protein DedD
MNDVDYPEKPSGFLLGKEFIIVIVIVFSGLSFTLGYFVGRNSGSAIPGASLRPAESPAEPDLKDASQGQRPGVASESVPVETPERHLLQAAVKKTPPEIAVAPASAQAHQPSQAVDLKQKEEPRANVSEKVSGTPPAKAASEKPITLEPPSSAGEEETAYTVQIGAFKSPLEARQLKTNFDKKGLKTYISATKNAKGQKVYKVKTGEFREKKEAEVLALKLRKTEGLHTYVTTRAE